MTNRTLDMMQSLNIRLKYGSRDRLVGGAFLLPLKPMFEEQSYLLGKLVYQPMCQIQLESIYGHQFLFSWRPAWCQGLQNGENVSGAMRHDYSESAGGAMTHP